MEVRMPDWLLWLLVAAIGAVAGWTLTRPRRRPGGAPRRDRSAAPPRPRGRSTAPHRPRGEPTTPPRQRSAPGRPDATTVTTKPKPGEIWWADVPYEDGTGSKVRPCLVLRVRRGGVDVLKITSQDKSGRHDHVQIPTKSWDPKAEHDSFLDLSDPIRVATASFQDRAGVCDPVLWRRVRQLHGRAG
jgi:hypothetical protein